MRQRSWPVVFEVTLRSLNKDTRTYKVLTWLGAEKAIAMATAVDRRGIGTPDGILDVEIEELGEAPRAQNGTVAISPDCIHDRMEF